MPVGLIAMAALLLASCAAPPPPRPEPPPSVAPPVVEAPVEQPMSPEDAAEQRLAAAEARPDLEAVRAAAEAVLALPTPPSAGIARIQTLWAGLRPEETASAPDRLLGARIALLTDDATTALARLQPPDPMQTETEPLANLELAARLYRQLDRWMDALTLHVLIDMRGSGDPAARQRQHQAIWQLLAMLDDRELFLLAEGRGMLPPEDDPGQLLAGWASLFLELRAAGLDTDRMTRNLDRWKSQHVDHPGAGWARELQEVMAAPADANLLVAVLLPLSGPLQDLGEAVLEGILAQYYAMPSTATSASELLILDTAGDPEGALSAYREAVAGGANRVIGPLSRPEVERIAENEADVPTLFLNRPNRRISAPSSALSLAPEEDARVAAARALNGGDRNAIMLLPEGEFGDRVGGSFRRHFEAGGGRVLGEYRLDPSADDLNQQVGLALGIEESEERIRRMQALLQIDLKADPQIRPELQAILLAGAARDLRMLVPHIHYHQASHLRILATSLAYEGFPQPIRDGDLGGVEFPDAPLLHREALASTPGAFLLPEPPADPESRWLRFTALGMDAMAGAALFSKLQTASHLRLQGAAGSWALRPDTGLWVREPIWMEFRDGLPRPSPARTTMTASGPP